MKQYIFIIFALPMIEMRESIFTYKMLGGIPINALKIIVKSG